MSRTRLATLLSLVGVITVSVLTTPTTPVIARAHPPAMVMTQTIEYPDIRAEMKLITSKKVAHGGYWVTATFWPSQLSTLSGISERVYGTARNWQGLCNANRLANCNNIAVGQRIFAPLASKLDNTAPVRPATQRASRSSNVPTTNVSGWVHPLASGKRGISCWGAPRDGGSRSHQGVDISEPSGTPIRSVHAGTVVLSRWTNGGGNTVGVDHGNGVQSIYMHMNRLGLGVGTRVNAGTTIGYVGSTGNSEGPHLHFEVHRGLWNRINPAPFMRSVGVNIGC